MVNCALVTPAAVIILLQPTRYLSMTLEIHKPALFWCSSTLHCLYIRRQNSSRTLHYFVACSALFVVAMWQIWHYSTVSTHHFYRASVYSRAILIQQICLSVALSVRPSVRYVPVSADNGLTYRHGFLP